MRSTLFHLQFAFITFSSFQLHVILPISFEESLPEASEFCVHHFRKLWAKSSARGRRIRRSSSC